MSIKWNKKKIADALRASAHPRADREGVRLHRDDGGSDHVTTDENGHITTFAAGKGWSDQRPEILGSLFDNKHVEKVVRGIYARRSQIYAMNGNQFRD